MKSRAPKWALQEEFTTGDSRRKQRTRIGATFCEMIFDRKGLFLWSDVNFVADRRTRSDNLPLVAPPTFEQMRDEMLRAYAAPDAPILAPGENEYDGPNIAMLASAFPGQITFHAHSPWLWSRDPSFVRPPQIEEASKVYFGSGATSPIGPALWFDTLLRAKRGKALRFSPYTTLYVPIDLFENIDEQMRESKRFCEAAKRKLIEISGRRPIPSGAGHDKALAEGILMVVLRKWGRQSVGVIARRFYGRDDQQTRRLTTRRIHSVKKLLRCHFSGFGKPILPSK